MFLSVFFLSRMTLAPFLVQILCRHAAGIVVMCSRFHLMLPFTGRLFELFSSLLLIYIRLAVINGRHFSHISCPRNHDLQIYGPDIQRNSPHFFSQRPTALFKRAKPDLSSIGIIGDKADGFLNRFD